MLPIARAADRRRRVQRMKSIMGKNLVKAGWARKAVAQIDRAAKAWNESHSGDQRILIAWGYKNQEAEREAADDLEFATQEGLLAFADDEFRLFIRSPLISPPLRLEITLPLADALYFRPGWRWRSVSAFQAVNIYASDAAIDGLGKEIAIDGLVKGRYQLGELLDELLAAEEVIKFDYARAAGDPAFKKLAASFRLARRFQRSLERLERTRFGTQP
jgi:hypothetical protein